MVRPSDWYLVDLFEDPTPGDGFGIRRVAQKYSDIAYVAANAASVVRGMRSSHSAEAWVGEAGDVFRSETDRMPGELQKADDSYSVVAEALTVWASALEDAQAQADRGLAQARDAYADLSVAQSALSEAQRSWSMAHAQQLSQQKLQKQYQDVPPPAGVTMPTDAQLRATNRNVTQSQDSVDAASASVASATARLEAAKRLVMEAKAARDAAEQTAVKAIGDAKGKAVKPSSVWEAIQDSAAWQAIVVIATVVLTIVSIVAIFVGGPLVWAIIAAATALLMLNALMSIAQGKNAWLELGLLAIGLIPGGRALTSAVEIARVFRSGETVGRGLLAVGGHLLSVSKTALVSTFSKTALLASARSLRQSAYGLVPGVTSALRSFPGAVRSVGLDGAGALRFVPDLAQAVRSDFHLGSTAAWADHLTDIGRTDPAKAASLWQGTGGYHGIDDWSNGVAHAGDTFEVGANADGRLTTGFALDGGAAHHAGGDLNTVWEGAQVSRGGPASQYRTGLITLQSTGDVPVATSLVHANPQFGAGGLHQSYFPDLTANLQNGQVVVVSNLTHRPLPPSAYTFTEITNHAGQSLGTVVKVDLGQGDVLRLVGDPERARFPTAFEAARANEWPGARIGIHLTEAGYNAAEIPDAFEGDRN